jgi:hypothetical protein
MAEERRQRAAGVPDIAGIARVIAEIGKAKNLTADNTDDTDQKKGRKILKSTPNLCRSTRKLP